MGGDYCAVWGCDNDRRNLVNNPERIIIKPHVGVLRWYSPLNKKDINMWTKLINRKDLTVTYSTKVCSNHFVIGYRCKTSCPNPTLFMRGYEESCKSTRPLPKVRAAAKPKLMRKRKVVTDDHSGQSSPPQSQKHAKLSAEASSKLENEQELFHLQNTHPKVTANQSEPSSIFEKQNNTEGNQNSSSFSPTRETGSQTELNSKKIKRDLFTEQATSTKNCYRYTGLSRDKLNLIYHFVEEKAHSLRYWKGSADTTIPSKKKKNLKRELTPWEEFVLTLVRIRKKFDVYFLADVFEITTGQVSRIFNTWVIFLSNELSFLVPWPSQTEVRRNMPKRFYKLFPNLRIIIDCLELFIQKPKLPSSQKITWSNYKHRNTAKLLIGITPDGVISFVPPLWTGMVSDKEIVRGTGLVNILDEGDAVMADKGFIIRDLLTFKKVHLISPAFCRGPRLTSRATTYSRRVASLRSHVERYILKLKQFRILSGVIPLSLKPMLDRLIFIAAALCNLNTKPIS